MGENEDRAREDRADEESATVARPGPAAAPPLKSWKEMREWAASLLLTRTGQDVSVWNRRVAAARDLGAATVRIPLTRPEDVDAEVLGWLRRAYRENAAPPSPRRPPRRPAPVLGQQRPPPRPGLGRRARRRHAAAVSAAPSSGSWTSIPAWSRKRYAPGTGWSHESG